MKSSAQQWRHSVPELIKFLTPLVATLGRSERRRSAMQYVEGLLAPGQRKSIEPMAARLGVDSQSLQQLLTSSPWSDEALWRAIRQEVIPHLEPLEAWVVDETGWLKQGRHSVGVSHQYCGAAGKSANCQVSVELVVSEGWVAAPIAAQLYLPKSWSEDAKRRAEAGVPAEIVFHTKSELALKLIEQAHADGVGAAPVLGDSAYGDSAEFRQGVRGLGMEFFLQVESTHKAWTEPVALARKRTRYALASNVPPARTWRRSSPSTAAMEALCVEGSQRPNAADSPGVVRGPSGAPSASRGERAGTSLVGRRLAGGCFRSVSLLLGSPASTPE